MSEIRQQNFQQIASRFKSQAELASVLDTTPGYINQLLSGHRGIGERTARKFEAKLRLKALALDIDNEPIEGVWRGIVDTQKVLSKKEHRVYLNKIFDACDELILENIYADTESVKSDLYHRAHDLAEEFQNPAPETIKDLLRNMAIKKIKS